MDNSTQELRREALNQKNAESVGTASYSRPKDIFLFSDGTGNSSGKLFKTNVWRLYEALDLGEPVAEGNRVQIAYYDNGVGTSGFKPFAILGGVFGAGLKASVQRLYMFLCRNYAPGDRIFTFGFSRGAFTIRLLVGLIAAKGVLRYIDETQLSAQTKAAWKDFRADFGLTNLLANAVFRSARQALSGLRANVTPKRREEALTLAHHDDRTVKLEFVGIWDTVAAYGGPFVEITRGFEKWVSPLTLDNYKLSTKVHCARHALAIDDQRDAFHPLLWDEVHEQSLITSGEVPVDRMKQVWFSGMHADVGGGYPDECLSYVSLVWMLDELKARCPDVRLLNIHEGRIRAMSNVYGPLHDSRGGIGAYYRVQPRKIAALLHDAGNDDQTQIFRDPQISGDRYQRGLIVEPVKIHHSVFDRIVAGTDGYAPINLPRSMTLVPPPRPTASQAKLYKFVADQISRDDFQSYPPLQERLWDYVWLRRILYFLTVAGTLLLVLMPVWGGNVFLNENVDDRTVTGNILDFLAVLLPDFVRPWIDAIGQRPWMTIALAGTLIFLMRTSKRVDRGHLNRSASLWRGIFRLPVERQYNITATSPIRTFREHRLYQRLFGLLKWTILPNIVGLFILALIPYLSAVILTQTSLVAAEKLGLFCEGRNVTYVPSGEGQAFDYSPNSACHRLNMEVTKGDSYTVRIAINNWQNGDYEVESAVGLSANKNGVAGLLGALFRRVVPAGYLEPLIMISDRGKNKDLWTKLRSDAHIQRLDWISNEGVWQGEFTAGATGTLTFFVNDAILPFGLTDDRPLDLTGRNSGTACVVVLKKIDVNEDVPLPEVGKCPKM